MHDKNGGEAEGLGTLTVDTTISLFRNSLILKQLALVVVIPLLFLVVLLTWILWPPDAETVQLIAKIIAVVGGIVVLLMLFAMAVVLRGRYEYTYRFDRRGVTAAVGGSTARTTSIVNTLLLFTGKPTAMGAGLMAQSRRREFLSWSDVRSVEVDETQRLVSLDGESGRLMSLMCGEDDFAAVVEYCRSAVARANAERSDPAPSGAAG